MKSEPCHKITVMTSKLLAVMNEDLVGRCKAADTQ